MITIHLELKNRASTNFSDHIRPPENPYLCSYQIIYKLSLSMFKVITNFRIAVHIHHGNLDAANFMVATINGQ